MKKAILALLFAAVIAVSPVQSAEPVIFKSVRALAMVSEELILDNYCTVSSINEKLHYWLTAAHCVTNEDGTVTAAHRYIDGDVVVVEKLDVENDLAILYTKSAHAPALKLASVAPDFGDTVLIVGHPFGWEELIYVRGEVTHPNFHLPGTTRYILMHNAVTTSGNSGSPIVNVRNEVISVHQMGWNRSSSYQMGGGATYKALAAFKAYFAR